jgi:diketogulonate reductase-like aldo/keto reductase
MKMKYVELPSGERVPALGQGTWHMGEDPARREEEIATLQQGMDLGLTLIDTAEMYGEGAAEKLVGAAIAGRRDQVFIVTKVYPHNATRRGAAAACERSLRRLGTDRIDLYLLHWRGDVPLEETFEALAGLQRAGKIRHYGVSNLDLSDLRELWPLPGGTAVATNQLLYNLARRGIEWELLPWLRERRIPIMAYSPFEQGRLLRDSRLNEFSRRHGMTPVETALSWLLSHRDVVAIPKTGRRGRLRENVAALARDLTPAQLVELDRLFPPPARARPLEML